MCWDGKTCFANSKSDDGSISSLKLGDMVKGSLGLANSLGISAAGPAVSIIPGCNSAPMICKPAWGATSVLDVGLTNGSMPCSPQPRRSWRKARPGGLNPSPPSNAGNTHVSSICSLLCGPVTPGSSACGAADVCGHSAEAGLAQQQQQQRVQDWLAAQPL